MLRFAILSGTIILALARGVSAQQRDALKSDALGVDHIKTLQFLGVGVVYSSKVFLQMSILTGAVRLTVKRSNFAINY